MLLLTGIIPACLIVCGLGHPVQWALLVPGAVLIAIAAAAFWFLARAGLGVTADHILIRDIVGPTTRIPWAQVTGFAGRRLGSEGKYDDTVFVLTADGKRWESAGYAASGNSPAELWRLLRVLEGERLARTPGGACTLPPPQPNSGEAPAARRSLSAVLGVIMLIVFGAGFLYGGMANLGPALRAASGRGTVGYFVPEKMTTGKGAHWVGEFRLSDGAVLRRNTTINDFGGDLRRGVPVAARDTDGPDGVYTLNDPGAWHTPASLIVVAAGLDAAVLVVLVPAAVRRLRPSRRAFGSLTGDTPADPWPYSYAPARAQGVDAAVELAQQRGWTFSPVIRQDLQPRRNASAAGARLGRLNGTLDGRPFTVLFSERVTSLSITLPAGTVPKVVIKANPNSGRLAWKENPVLGKLLMTAPAREALSRAGFSAVIFIRDQLAGAFPRDLTADEIVDGLHGLEALLAAMPRDVLGAHGVF